MARFIANTRGLSTSFLSATAVTENSFRSLLHWGHSWAVSDADVLQREQICIKLSPQLLNSVDELIVPSQIKGESCVHFLRGESKMQTSTLLFGRIPFTAILRGCDKFYYKIEVEKAAQSRRFFNMSGSLCAELLWQAL
jgi:hypothetical protein